MKKKKIGKILLTIIITLFVTVFLFFLIVIFPIISREPIFTYQIKKLLRENKEIVSITACWGWGGTGGDLEQPLAIDIKMENGKRLFLSYIRSLNLKTPFYLVLIGESSFKVGYVTNGFIAVGGIPIDLISQETGIEINSVIDVINNYDKIYSFIDSLTKLKDINEQLEDEYQYSSKGSGRGNVGLGWRHEVSTIQYSRIDKEFTWFILNVTRNDFPDFYAFYDIDEGDEYEVRIIYRNVK